MKSFLLVLMIGVAAHAQSPRELMLVSPEWLQRHLGTVNVLYIGDRASYDAGHIPGAALVETSSLLVQRDGTPNELPPVDVLERVFRTAGIENRGRIVVYSNDPLFAARAWFTLDYLGQGSRTSVLDGGYARWVRDDCLISHTPVIAKSGSFEARVMPQAVIRIGAVRELVRLRHLIAPGLVFVDARPPAQFSGKEAGPGVRRAGRIPGSVNVPLDLNFASDGRFRSEQELRSIYESADVSTVLVNVAYCRTGMQASVTYFILRYLGYDTALYDGSYLEWSNAGEMIES
jgi:thiosulfate/3-mercaptopyruvate sulfurtransferase